LAKKARVWTGTEFVELASAQTDLTAYSTTAQMNTALPRSLSTTKSDTFTTTANATWTDITGLSVTITPSTSAKNILIMANVDVGASADVLVALRLMRGATPIGIGDTAGSRTSVTSGRYLNSGATGTATHATIPLLFLDSPATTSAITYKIQCYQNAAGTIAINRSATDTDNAANFRAISNITVIEF